MYDAAGKAHESAGQRTDRRAGARIRIRLYVQRQRAMRAEVVRARDLGFTAYKMRPGRVPRKRTWRRCGNARCTGSRFRNLMATSFGWETRYSQQTGATLEGHGGVPHAVAGGADAARRSSMLCRVEGIGAGAAGERRARTERAAVSGSDSTPGRSIMCRWTWFAREGSRRRGDCFRISRAPGCDSRFIAGERHSGTSLDLCGGASGRLLARKRGGLAGILLLLDGYRSSSIRSLGI